MSPTDSSIRQPSVARNSVQPPWRGQVDVSLENSLDQKSRMVSKGTIMAFEGNKSQSRFCVMSGWLAATKSLPQGERQIVEFVLPGETYDPTAVDGQTSFVDLEALCDVLVAVIDATLWAQLLNDLPDLRRSERLKEVAARTRQSERMLRLGKSKAETRISYVLIEFYMRVTAIGAVKENGVIHIPLSQQHLAEFTGLSSVHVCRTLRRLNRQGLITTSDHMDINIHDVQALAVLAGIDLDRLRREIIPGASLSPDQGRALGLR